MSGRSGLQVGDGKNYVVECVIRSWCMGGVGGVGGVCGDWWCELGGELWE